MLASVVKPYCSIKKPFEQNVVSLATVFSIADTKTAARETKWNVNVVFISQGAIVIHEVYEDGAAAQDGRLWAGDQILEVSYPML